MAGINIVGEDPVTRAIIKRLINDYRPDIELGTEYPVRGSDIKRQAILFNKLDAQTCILTDQDNAVCPPIMIRDWFGDALINRLMLFRVATTEAEVWLMADRDGFAGWLGIDAVLIPQPTKVGRLGNYIELPFPMKPSLFLMRELASHSTHEDVKKDLTPKEYAKKGPAYNSTLIPFISDHWNPQKARKNSTSLDKAINRLIEF